MMNYIIYINTKKKKKNKKKKKYVYLATDLVNLSILDMIC